MSYAMTDAATMLRRNLRHALRYPGLTIGLLAVPVILLLLFVFVLGGALGSGIGGQDGGEYVDYLAPGIILITITTGTARTAVSVCTDVTEGIIARFRTMAISPTAVLTGHVVGSVIQSMVSTTLVIGMAILVGFRPTADPLRWLGVAGVLLMLTLALTWLAVPLGLISPNAEAASNIVSPLLYLPFVGSTFVPTDSMPAGVRWFAEYQPFTPVIETLRGLLLGTPIGNNLGLAIGWCAVLAAGGYLWAKARFTRPLVARPA
jgi:ABC-2 type transport system permease protein